MKLEDIYINKKFLKLITQKVHQDEIISQEKMNDILGHFKDFLKEDSKILENRYKNSFFFELLNKSSIHLINDLYDKKNEMNKTQDASEQLLDNFENLRKNAITLIQKARNKILYFNEQQKDDDLTALIDDNIRASTVDRVLEELLKKAKENNMTILENNQLFIKPSVDSSDKTFDLFLDIQNIYMLIVNRQKEAVKSIDLLNVEANHLRKKMV